jgi:nucleoside 2-deoxyribosyltransferase
MANASYAEDCWKSATVYLCGPIERSDNALSWREDITSRLIAFGLSAENILDPCNKPLIPGRPPLSEEQRLLQQMRARGDWDELESLMKQIIHADLKMVDKSDFVIANLQEEVPTAGSIHEIVLARSQRKPVFLVHGPSGPNLWLCGLIEQRDRICASMDEVMERLATLRSHGPQTSRDASEWLLFHPHLKDSALSAQR